MAKIHAKADGTIIRILITPREIRDYPVPPVATASTVEFDPDTNQDIVLGLRTQIARWSVVAGVLRRDGVPFAINPPGRPYADKGLPPALRTALFGMDPMTVPEVTAATAGIAAYASGVAPTAGQRDAVIKLLLQLSRVNLRAARELTD